MSFFKKFSKSKKDVKAPTTGEAIRKLRETEDLLIKKQEFLERKIETEIEIAKKNASKNKKLAIQALKRKKKYAKQLEQIDGTLGTLDLQREVLEAANINTAVTTAMKEAANTLKTAHKHMDVDQLHEMIDDIAEQHNISKEISEAISNPVAFETDVDEDELERELEELEQETLENELLKVNPKVSTTLPDVPIEKIKPKVAPRKVYEEDGMKELEKWAS